MTWPKVLAIALPILASTAATTYTMYRSAMTIHHGLIHSAIIANYSRFGDVDTDKLVVIDDSRAYFMRDGALWTCDVKDDYLIRSSVRVVDVMNIQGAELKEVMAAVDALNMVDDDDDDEDDDGAGV